MSRGRCGCPQLRLLMLLQGRCKGRTGGRAGGRSLRRPGSRRNSESPACRRLAASQLTLAGKSTTLGALLDILNSTKSSDIAGLVRNLSIDEQDTLMKYIYKGLGSPELGASAVLLGWHEKVSGCAVRSRRRRADQWCNLRSLELGTCGVWLRVGRSASHTRPPRVPRN